jgi:hypothetical protein
MLTVIRWVYTWILERTVKIIPFWRGRLMKILVYYLGVVILGTIPAAIGKGQSDSPKGRPVPAATFSQFECSGFIAASQVPAAVQVYNGADNDLYEPLQDFATGDYVYLHRKDGRRFAVGESYSLARPENGFYLKQAWVSGMLENQILPPSSRYTHQRLKIESLGRPYNSTGIVRVIKVTPEGAIARVVFTCNGIDIGDIGLPYVAQPIPEYIPSVHLSRFALPNGKLAGILVAAAQAVPYLGEGSIGFLNIGKKDGVVPGQRFRIFAIFRHNLPDDLQGIKPRAETPRETVGEFVVLRVQEKSATGIVVNSLREVAVGDGVELE